MLLTPFIQVKQFVKTVIKINLQSKFEHSERIKIRERMDPKNFKSLDITQATQATQTTQATHDL